MKHSPGFLKIVDDAKTRIRQTDVAEVREMLSRGDRFVLVDVREESEYERSHLPGAVHLSKGLIERDIEAWIPDHDTPIVLYCGGGFRSALSADNIQKMGYNDVLSMDGGFRAWCEAGLPTER